MPLPVQTPPDDSWVLLSVPLRSPPLLQHHQGLSVEDETTEEEGDGRYEHDPQAVCHVVPGQAGAAEVKAGIHLYASQGQQPTDPIHYRLRVGVEVLEDHPEALHRVLLAKGVPPGKSWAARHSLSPFAPCSAATGRAAQLSPQSVEAGGRGWKGAAVAGRKPCAGASPPAHGFHKSLSHPMLIFQGSW